MQLKQVLLVVAVLAWRTDGRAVARDDVKGIKTLQPDEARDDPFFDHNPQYDFAYRIRDEETGDAKDQTEERRGDAVHGSYSVVDPDGTLRVVKYTADDEHGFNAVVTLTPGHSKPIVPAVKAFARVAQPTKNVAQHHIDVPVPVQHHVLTSSSQQVLDNRGVLVQHPAYESGVLMHQHVIQPPLALGVHQNVHHLIPQNAYQLHRIHQIPGSGIHHQTLPLVQEVQVQEQQQDVLKLQEVPTPMMPQQEQSLLKRQEAATMAAQQQELRHEIQQGLQHGPQQGIQQDILQQTLQQNIQNDIQQGIIQHGILQHGLQQQGLHQNIQPGILQQVFVQPGVQQDLPQGLLQHGIPQPVLQQSAQQGITKNPQQGLQQDLQQGVQQANLNQGLQQEVLQQEQQQQSALTDQQDNKLQQSKTDPALPVVELRQSVQNVKMVSQDHQQLRSLDGEEQAQLQVEHEVQQVHPQLQQVHQVHHEVQQVQQAIPHQRTFAVYRTTASSAGVQGTNFITFNSPYAQYTIS